MRILCDACENAAAIVFCAADEAALCRACDEKVKSPHLPFPSFFLGISDSDSGGFVKDGVFLCYLRFGSELCPLTFVSTSDLNYATLFFLCA